jgi:hypothetical protein
MKKRTASNQEKSSAGRQHIHHRIRHKIRRYHRMRKIKEENLPAWKEKWNSFNEKRLGWLEKTVDRLIPWLVLLLLFIILGEFSEQLNLFDWQWMETAAEFFHAYEDIIHIIDRIIIGFFIADLYFNFFKKAKISTWLKTSILDIIAVAPLGLIFRVSEISEAQSILHVTEDIGKEAGKVLKETEAAAKIAKETEAASKIIKAEQEAAKLARLQKTSRFARFSRVIARIPRLLRLNRLTEFFKRK